MKSNLLCEISDTDSIDKGDDLIRQCLKKYFSGNYRYFRRTEILFSKKYIIVFGYLKLKNKGGEILTITKINRGSHKITITIKDISSLILLDEVIDVITESDFNQAIMLEKLNNMIEKWDLKFNFTQSLCVDLIKSKCGKYFERAFCGVDLRTGEEIDIVVALVGDDLNTISHLMLAKTKTKNPV